MIPKELLKKIRRIEIRTSHMVNDVLAGQYHSAFKGRGMEFEEVRNYQIGDDVRTIDWNVSARYGHPFVKIFKEERELTVMLLVDLSASHTFGSVDQLKREVAAEICATLAFSAIRNNDKIGMITFTDRVEQFVPARKGSKHVLRIIRDLLYYEPDGTGTNIKLAFEHLNRVTSRKAVVFIVSDFQDAGYEQPMRIAKRRHDIIPITITDPREVTLPSAGLIELIDSETGQPVIVDSSSKRIRGQYTAAAIATAEKRDELFRRSSIDAIDVSTDQPFIDPLQKFFRKRKAKR